MCSRGVQRLTRSEVISLLEEMREHYKKRLREIENRAPTKFLELLEKRSSILIEAGVIDQDGQEVSVYEFRHLTFQEYLAGLALIDGRYPGHVRGSRLAQRLAPLAGEIEQKESDIGEPEAVVSENWREALRLCLAACNDDDVDDSLLAILEPTMDEDADKIARPRAIMAALCLADEPNVSEDIAVKVLRSVAQRISEPDGNGRVRSAMDAACMEIARSVWLADLQHALISEFRSRYGMSQDPGSVAGECAMISAAHAPTPEDELVEWLRARVVMLNGEDENAAIQSALVIMQLAFSYNEKLPDVPGIAESLLKMVERGSCFTYASVWALLWLCGASIQEGIWNPTPEEIQPIIDVCGNEQSTDDERHWGVVIIGKGRARNAVSLLSSLLEDEYEMVRKRTVEALVRVLAIESPDKDALFAHKHEAIDPRDTIGRNRIVPMAEKLEMTEEEVEKLYERLAPTFKLNLQWTTA